MTSEYRTYNPSSANESFVPAINLAGSMGVAAFAIVVWQCDVPFLGGSADASQFYNGVYLALSSLTLGLAFFGIISSSAIASITHAVLLAVCSATAVVPSFSVLMEGPKGAGTAAAGVGWLIALAVFAIGAFGLSAAILSLARVLKLRKRSHPHMPSQTHVGLSQSGSDAKYRPARD
jgi:hypothetical protein